MRNRQVRWHLRPPDKIAREPPASAAKHPRGVFACTGELQVRHPSPVDRSRRPGRAGPGPAVHALAPRRGSSTPRAEDPGLAPPPRTAAGDRRASARTEDCGVRTSASGRTAAACRCCCCSVPLRLCTGRRFGIAFDTPYRSRPRGERTSARSATAGVGAAATPVATPVATCGDTPSATGAPPPSATPRDTPSDLRHARRRRGARATLIMRRAPTGRRCSRGGPAGRRCARSRASARGPASGPAPAPGSE